MNAPFLSPRLAWPADDAYKVRVFNPDERKTVATLLGPTFAGPPRQLLTCRASTASGDNTAFLAYHTGGRTRGRSRGRARSSMGQDTHACMHADTPWRRSSGDQLAPLTCVARTWCTGIAENPQSVGTINHTCLGFCISLRVGRRGDYHNALFSEPLPPTAPPPQAAAHMRAGCTLACRHRTSKR